MTVVRRARGGGSKGGAPCVRAVSSFATIANRKIGVTAMALAQITRSSETLRAARALSVPSGISVHCSAERDSNARERSGEAYRQVPTAIGSIARWPWGPTHNARCGSDPTVAERAAKMSARRCTNLPRIRYQAKRSAPQKQGGLRVGSVRRARLRGCPVRSKAWAQSRIKKGIDSLGSAVIAYSDGRRTAADRRGNAQNAAPSGLRVAQRNVSRGKSRCRDASKA